jgi:hypothetical protein
MRLTSFSAAILLALLSIARAQQSPAPTGDTIGHPPPLPGPPPISEPSTAQPAQGAAAPKSNEPAVKGYTGAYAPAGTPPPAPYYSGPLPAEPTGGPGLNVVGPDGSTRTVKAVPCTVSARETDGSTTCVGIPDQSSTKRRRR